MKAVGMFEVELRPLETYAEGRDGMSLGRMSIDKTFRGDLEGTSCGEMLSARTAVAGSAGYVAIEQVSGTVAGRTGAFVVQHFGVMSAGNQRATLEIVPDSGSGDLAGISGTMSIAIENGQHHYVLEYLFE